MHPLDNNKKTQILQYFAHLQLLYLNEFHLKKLFTIVRCFFQLIHLTH